jgi:hypothetical protein
MQVKTSNEDVYIYQLIHLPIADGMGCRRHRGSQSSPRNLDSCHARAQDQANQTPTFYYDYYIIIARP